MNLTMKDLREMQQALIGRANQAAAQGMDLYQKYGDTPAVDHYRVVENKCDRLALQMEKWLMRNEAEKESQFRLEIGPANEQYEWLDDILTGEMNRYADRAMSGLVRANVSCDEDIPPSVYHALGAWEALHKVREDIQEVPF